MHENPTVIPIRPVTEIPRLHRLEGQDAQVARVLDEIKDPELPMLSISDLGILREFGRSDTGQLTVVITPTYSGCPAVRAIRLAIESALRAHGYENVAVIERLFPAWTTDWMSAAGKAALVANGIAAPLPAACSNPVPAEGLSCPNCQATETRLLTEFGSTACKAMYRCDSCLETFDYFKGF